MQIPLSLIRFPAIHQRIGVFQYLINQVVELLFMHSQKCESKAALSFIWHSNNWKILYFVLTEHNAGVEISRELSPMFLQKAPLLFYTWHFGILASIAHSPGSLFHLVVPQRLLKYF